MAQHPRMGRRLSRHPPPSWLIDDQARVGFHVDRLGEFGPLLDEPHTKQLERKLQELRLCLSGRPTRITYWIAPGRVIVLLTGFVKTRPNERREMDRAMGPCSCPQGRLST